MQRTNFYLLTVLFVGLFTWLSFPLALTGAPVPEDIVEVVLIDGQASTLLPSGNWVAIPHPTPTNRILFGPGDEIRVEAHSRALIRYAGLTTELGAQSQLRIRKPEMGRFKAFLVRGWFYFFHRDKPGDFDIETPTVPAAIRGTEFVMKVEDNLTLTTVVDGQVELKNQNGSLTLTNGQSGEAAAGRPPTALQSKIETINAIQWCLYYPAVLDSAELGFSDAERQVLAASLADYRKGDLLAALRDYPEGREPVSDAEKVYRAALLLAVGQIDEAQQFLNSVPSTDPIPRRLADALQKLIAAVKFNPNDRSSRREEALINPGIRDQSLLTAAATNGALATEWLAESYYRQSRSDQPKALESALEAGTNAVAISPEFGFAWTHLAELEFSFGRTERAMKALEKGLNLSPRNGQAMALKGFLFAAQNRIQAAVGAFDAAIEMDPGLGNAWLGRGLCRIRKGDVQGGRQDIQVAATLEPQRAFLRSYLGKAFSIAGDDLRAEKELQLAKELDHNDPTAWLYSALLHQQQNEINQAARDLEYSQELNDNRRLYRARFLLDQDRAVRSANLAEIYQDAGMNDVAVREASRAVQADHANFSAHLFLANSYDELRDPNQVELRYETAWLNEYLLANLLAPVGAGTLSPYISQQEYSRLFEQDRFGLASSTEYLSRGAWSQAAAQYGTLGTFAYSVEEFYRADPGQRPNNDIELLTLDFKAKQQITAKDSLYLQVIRYEAKSGDTTRYFDPTNAHLGFRNEERQEPIVLAGYHRQWSPESHTLILGGVLNDTLKLSDPNQPALLLRRDSAGGINGVGLMRNPATGLFGIPSASLGYESKFDGITLEGEQIWQPNRHTFIGGGRYQHGTFDTSTSQGEIENIFFDSGQPSPLAFDPIGNRFATTFERVTGFGYWNWQVIDPLLLTGGVSYDWLRYPENFRIAPISSGEQHRESISPKAGFILTPLKGTTVRGAFTRSLGGVSFDQSFRLEPTQVGGFNQAYRSLMPESVVGSLSAASFETWGIGLDQKLGRGTYFGARFERLASRASEFVGVEDITQPLNSSGISSTRQSFDFEENDLILTFNQLVGEWLALGGRYKFSEAKLGVLFNEIPTLTPPFALPPADLKATLHQLQLQALFYHPAGFFGQGEALWTDQTNRGYNPELPSEDFWQVNLHAGYRFPRRRAEICLSLLNVGNQDYRLNPLSLTPELPRTRTLAASFRFYF